MPTKPDTIISMPRIFIQVEVSQPYKSLYQDILGPYGNMSKDIQRLLEQEYPQLKEFADRERAIKRGLKTHEGS